MAMAVLAPSRALPCLLLLSLLSGEVSWLVNARAKEESLNGVPTTWRTWCIAKPSASREALQVAIDYACSTTDCGPVRERGNCFQPDTMAHHASFAMNAYYQARGANKWNCDFSNAGLIALTDPSHGYCQFGGSVPKATIPKKEETWCVAKPGTPDKALQANIDFICRKLGDCSDIQEHGSCFYPNTVVSHASMVMNLYYKTDGRYRCDFNNTGILVTTSPDFGECLYV